MATIQIWWAQAKGGLAYGLLGVDHVGVGAMATGGSPYFASSMLLCALLHGLKSVQPPPMVWHGVNSPHCIDP